MIKAYLYNWGVAISQLGNTAQGGDPGETMSSVIGKKLRDGQRLNPYEFIWKTCVDRFLSKDHWIKSIQDDKGSNSARNRKQYT